MVAKAYRAEVTGGIVDCRPTHDTAVKSPKFKINSTICLIVISEATCSPTTTQGIIDPTGMETFTNEPQLETILQKLMSSPCRVTKQVRWVFVVCPVL